MEPIIKKTGLPALIKIKALEFLKQAKILINNFNLFFLLQGQNKPGDSTNGSTKVTPKVENKKNTWISRCTIL